MKAKRNTLNTERLQAYFKGQATFDGNAIAVFYRRTEPEITASTVNWRIYLLVKSGILTRVGRGRFKLGEGRFYIPSISSTVKSLNTKLRAQFPYLPVCIWNTAVLNEFTIHQLAKFFTLIEVEKDAMGSVFHFLKENKMNAFLNPTSDVIENYIIGGKNSIIIKPLVSEAPMQNVQGVSTVTIEKLLVDIFSDEVVFAALQGSEMETIFREALEKYAVNENKMMRYADRKRKKENLDKYLNKVSKFRQQKQYAANL